MTIHVLPDPMYKQHDIITIMKGLPEENGRGGKSNAEDQQSDSGTSVREMCDGQAGSGDFIPAGERPAECDS